MMLHYCCLSRYWLLLSNVTPRFPVFMLHSSDRSGVRLWDHCRLWGNPSAQQDSGSKMTEYWPADKERSKSVGRKKPSSFLKSILPYFKSYPCNRLWRPIGLWDIKDPTLSSQIGSQMAERLPDLRTGHALLSRIIISLVLVLISVRCGANPRAWCGWKD
jgi:hypothetical protein